MRMRHDGSPSTSSRTGSKTHHLPILETREFVGLLSYPKPQQIPRGAAQSALNFITRETWVEVRPGYHPLGTESQTSGKIRGQFTAHKWDGTEVPFRCTSDGRLQYYDAVVAKDWVEVGGAGAKILAGASTYDENVYMDEYSSPAGAQLWVSSPNSDLIKVMVANPASWLSQYNSNKNFKGRIRIMQNAMWLWHYTTGLAQAANAVVQRSYIDAQAYTTHTDSSISLTPISGGVSGTLSKNSVANATVFATSFSYTDSLNTYSETFVDNYLGALTGSNGGTGTIDYSTGKFTLLPHQAPGGTTACNCTYSYEDSTNNGIADFTKSGTRLAGQGVSWLQNNGGDILAVEPYNGSFYVLHQRNAWIITPSADDSSATNTIYRNNVALSSERGAIATGEGIFYIDVTNASRPFVGLIEYNIFAQQVLPDDISSGTLDLSPYVFDKCRAYQGLDFILFFFRTSDSVSNNRCLLYNLKLSTAKKRIFDILDYFGSDISVYAGQLISGDSISDNSYKLFDGYDDDGGIPNCYWIGNADDHGVQGLKQTKKLWIEGYIGVNQSVDVYVQVDANTAYKVGTIKGNGTYVDTGQAITIGSLQIGVYPIGGPSSQPVGYHYLAEVIINSAKYKYFTIQFRPMGIGYFSVQMYANYDIRFNVDKLPLKYRARPGFRSANISGGGGTISFPGVVYKETPKGTIDGVNTVYTTTRSITSVLNFVINGEEITSEQYTIAGNQITFVSPLDASLSGKPFEITYV